MSFFLRLSKEDICFSVVSNQWQTPIFLEFAFFCFKTFFSLSAIHFWTFFPSSRRGCSSFWQLLSASIPRRKYNRRSLLTFPFFRVKRSNALVFHAMKKSQNVAKSSKAQQNVAKGSQCCVSCTEQRSQQHANEEHFIRTVTCSPKTQQKPPLSHPFANTIRNRKRTLRNHKDNGWFSPR